MSVQATAFSGYIDQPLHVKRTSLIETINTRLTEEQQKRADAQAKITERRQAAQDAVASLSPDELLNLVRQYVSDDLGRIVKMVEDAHETGRLKSVDMVETATETALAKYARVLNLATDDEIEVRPTDPLYPLL